MLFGGAKYSETHIRKKYEFQNLGPVFGVIQKKNANKMICHGEEDEKGEEDDDEDVHSFICLGLARNFFHADG